jgi:hypothetical protein
MSTELPLSTKNLFDNPFGYDYLDDHGIVVVCRLQSEIFFSECNGHFGPLWLCGRAIIDDSVCKSKVIVSLPFGFELHS